MRYVIASFILLAACAMQPKVGMSLDEWQGQCRGKTWAAGELVAAKEDMTAYICADPSIVYIFNGNTLEEVKRVPVRESNNMESAYLTLLGLEMMRQR